ncbi:MULTISPECIES: YkvA family protein [unclassified Barnesiella]|mgnify:FL=1|uniref:YkvA family protein n=1 Tax=unclassified Barnesiella TaxID=2645177 RepID=UPI001F8F6F55|nr:YkvA family protein [Barnesiella sp. ET7]MCR8911558.1 YkvA family protein [Barnesiella sp. ET7]HJB73753.1 DUF1232 domain-containing protein [Candidatus Barnesiella merdigallinarum]
MFTIICITILAYMIMGKDIKRLLARVKNVDWRDKINRIYIKLQPYALKVGRVAARPLLQFYYVMKDEKTSTLDRILIYAAIIYTISPVSLIPSAVFKFIGVLDEGAAVLYVYKKIKGKITPEINAQVDETLDQWFGTRYEMVRE